MGFFLNILLAEATSVSSTPHIWLNDEWIGGLIKLVIAVIIAVITGVFAVKKIFKESKSEEKSEKHEGTTQSIIIQQSPQQNQYAQPPQYQLPTNQYQQPPQRPLSKEELDQIVQSIVNIDKPEVERSYNQKVEDAYNEKIEELTNQVNDLTLQLSGSASLARDIEIERNTYKDKCDEFSLEIRRINDRYKMSKDVMNQTKSNIQNFLENTGPIKLVKRDKK